MTAATASIRPPSADMSTLLGLPQQDRKRPPPSGNARAAVPTLESCPQVLAVRRADRQWDQPAHQVRPLRVLLVDDHHLVAKVMAVLLRLDGHDVHIANDGAAALRHVDKCRPGVIFLDIGLPGMNGYEVAKRLRAREDTREIFLAALTGYGRAEDREQFRKAGFDDHLIKPVDFVDLRRMLTSVANTRKEVF